MSESIVGIVGEYDPAKSTHPVTNEALSHLGLRAEWVSTREIAARGAAERLAAYAGIFVSPGSPYESLEGAVAAVRHARERGVPLVGT
jgi:CTP synthase (UTP-ammonia lyase)